MATPTDTRSLVGSLASRIDLARLPYPRYHDRPRRMLRRAIRRTHAAVVALPLGERLNTALAKRSIANPQRQKYVPTEQLEDIYASALADLEDHGVTEPTYFEAGVFAGDSLATWARVVASAGGTLRAFGADSFHGLPPTVESDEGNWEEGQFWCPRAVTEWNLGRQGVELERVELIEGWFDETLTPELAERVGSVHVAMLDADAYSSTVPVLDFLTPLLADRAWLIFDDWYSGGNYDPESGESRGTGVERAFTEWLAANPEWMATDHGDYELLWRGDPRMAGKVFTIDRSEPNAGTRSSGRSSRAAHR